ncbi:hypothetical protein [Flavobacterium sp. FlaQc-50]|uniref:hypothetical protein n=1 Tax=unclassified Flavobacterium TaxID=196869 RepID=UPI003756BE98
MMNSLKMSVVFSFCLLVLSSCEKDNSSEMSSDEASKASVEKLYDSNSNLKREFGKSLVKSLAESKALRDLIKNKSLEMFDNDYEVLYQMIKDERLEGNITVREIILKNLGSEALLNLIEVSNPALTFFVPELPENSFSASIWDTEKQIPKVAIALTTSNDVPIINEDGTEDIIKAKEIPSFPVIVIKDNERVVVSRNKGFGKLKTRSLRNASGIEFKFIDDCFDKSKNAKKETSRNISSVALDTKIINAYNMYATADGWHRDFIYYGITPTTTKGPFKYDFQETVKSFTLLGDPTAAFNSLADQTGDPVIAEKALADNMAGDFTISNWSKGSFEFKIRIIVNGKNGIGSEIVKYFNVPLGDLFDFTFVKAEKGWNRRDVYHRKINSIKTIHLNIPIFNWDLDQYASTIKINVEEVDLTETIVLTDTRSVEFATNFSIDAAFGTLTKVGLKYGSSLKTITTSTVQRTFTQGNDLLGDVIVNFADNIIVNESSPGVYQTREYSSGLYSIAIEPTRVQ